MNLKQIHDKLNALYYVTQSVSFEEEKGGLFIFFSQYKSILGQCNKVYPKELTIKKMLLNTFTIREMLNGTKGPEAQYALQSEIKALINLLTRIGQVSDRQILQAQFTEALNTNGEVRNMA
ncbi:MAG TPA: hypothetical protein VL092_09840 [Chitinophagaceae bacterium]|nr:hypothetical protein [Chitinophagaceae bacterium]